jgi:hypothetical protein
MLNKVQLKALAERVKLDPHSYAAGNLADEVQEWLAALDRDPTIAVNQRELSSGEITYWRASAVDGGALDTALVNAGVSERLMPGCIAPETALLRALDTVKRERVKVFKVKDGVWVVKAEQPTSDGADVEHVKLCTVTMERSVTTGELAPEVTGNASYRNEILAAYGAARREYTGSDVGAWLAECVRALQGTALRDRGGVYFVPRTSVATFDTLIAAAKACGAATVRQIPVLEGGKAADAVLAALEDEAMTLAAQIEEDLEKNSEQGKRARRTKEITVTKLRAKVAEYERIFGARMDAVHNRIAGVRNRIAGVMVVAEAGAEGRDISGDRGALELDNRQAKPTKEPGLAGERQVELDETPSVQTPVAVQSIDELWARAMRPAPSPAQAAPTARPVAPAKPADDDDAAANRFAGLELD